MIRRFTITAPDFDEPGEGVMFSMGPLVVLWPLVGLHAWLSLDVLERERPDHVITWIDGDGDGDTPAAAIDVSAEWLHELIHIVYGFAMREHLNVPVGDGGLRRPPVLVPAHAEEALRHVPGHVMGAASLPREERR